MSLHPTGDDVGGDRHRLGVEREIRFFLNSLTHSTVTSQWQRRQIDDATQIIAADAPCALSALSASISASNWTEVIERLPVPFTLCRENDPG